MLEDLDLHSIADEPARELVRQLLNLLKGEQGQPTIKPNTPQPRPTDLSSEQERRTPKAWSKGRKTDHIPIDREQVVAVDPARLPPDAVFKGYEDVVVQDVLFRIDNVLFRKEKFYSPSQPTTSMASLPPGSHGQFGPGLKSLALMFYDGA